MMVTLLMYGYAVGQRSSRMIERHCRQDVAFRVITGNVVPDHATIARFVVRHQDALAGLFSQVLGLCDRAGLVAAGVIAIDGTRLAGNASKARNAGFERIAREILDQHTTSDEAEDEQHGTARGDELPGPLRTVEGRRAFFRAAGERQAPPELDAGDPEPPGDRTPPAPGGSEQRAAGAGQGGEPEPSDGAAPGAGGSGYVFDAQRIVARKQGREGWPREARRQLEARRWQTASAVPRSRPARLVIAGEYLEDELEAETRAQAAYEHYHATGRRSDGRRFGKHPKPYVAPEVPDGKVNLTDPDSRHIRSKDHFVQGYNAQAVVTETQIVLSAEITTSSVDFSALEPMVAAAIAELQRAGATTRPEVALADTQYWNEEHIDTVVTDHHVQVLIPPESGTPEQPRRWTGGRYDHMRAVLATEHGKALYRSRARTIEPVFGQTKHNRRVTRFHRRGRHAVRTEWRMLMATHNLAKLYRHRLATATG